MALHCYCYSHRGRDWLVYHNVPLKAREKAFIRRFTGWLIDGKSRVVRLNEIASPVPLVQQLQRACWS